MEEKKRVFTVLCIDGGGVRGLIPARILQEIEEKTGKPICELFDMIGGPSTGSIVAAGLSIPDPEDPKKPKYSALEMKNFYYKHSPKIFPPVKFKNLKQLSSGALYDSKPLDDALLTAFGDAKLKDSLTNIIVPATDIKNCRSVWITHIKGQKDLSPEGWSSMLTRDAVRASTTAPTYFPATWVTTTPNEDMPNVTHRHALIDGGFFSGNVLPHLLTEAKKVAPPDAEIVVVHVGTGMSEISVSPEEFNRLGPIGLVRKSILMSLVVNIPAADSVENMQQHMQENFYTFDGKMKIPENPKAHTFAMDDAREDSLKKLERFAEEEIIKPGAASLDRLCALLKDRGFAEEQHRKSKVAFEALAKKLEEPKTVKNLTSLYRKILQYANGIEDAKPEDRDDALKALAQDLTSTHRTELDRIYNVLQDKLEGQNKMMNAARELKDDFNKFFRKITGKDEPKKPENDNKPPQNNGRKKPPNRFGFNG